jgi:competence protein ComEA
VHVGKVAGAVRQIASPLLLTESEINMNVFKTLLAVLALAFAALTHAGEAIDINRADAATLAQLHGIGPAKAQAIVEYREANGPFLQVEDLAKVKGIGLRTVEDNRAMVTVGGEPVASADPGQP